MKHLCSQCDRIAVWYYMPSSELWTNKSRYLCEIHVEPYRGCSCSNNYEELDKKFPCIEFDYNKDGFENEN